MKMRIAIGSVALAAAIAATAACRGEVPPCDAMLSSGRGDIPRAFGYDYSMPDLEMMVGDTARSDLRDHFGPRDCIETPWTASWPFWELRSSDSSAVAVSVSAKHVLETAALEMADSVRVRVGLTIGPPDSDLEEYFHEFAVRVRPAGR